MKRSTLTVFILFILFILAPASLYAQEGKEIYWTSSRGIFKADLETRVVEELFPVTISDPEDLALDLSNGKMYWIDSGTSEILRANLDGSEIEAIITENLVFPNDLALDVDDGKIYWTDGWSAIQWANLDGSNQTEFIVTGEFATSIALDLGARKMYWIAEGKIMRSNMSRTEVEELVTGLVLPNDLMLDVEEGKMYWIDHDGDGTIFRANLDGSGVEYFVRRAGATEVLVLHSETERIYWIDDNGGLNSVLRDGSERTRRSTGVLFLPPPGMAIDPIADKLYLIQNNHFSRKIQRTNLDASGFEDLIVSEILEPKEITVDTQAGKVYWTDLLGRKIQRANLDGSDLEDLVSHPDINLGNAMAIDLVNNKIYWNNIRRIMRANLDGTASEELFLYRRCYQFATRHPY